MKVCCHDDLYGIEVQDPSLFQDDTASWVRIVHGVGKYVTDSMLTKEVDDIASEKPIAKARPRRKPTVTVTSVSIPVLERKWVDIETQRSHDQKCFEMSEAVTPDCYDMIKQSFEEATELSSTMTSSNSARRRSSMVLRYGLLEDWITTLAKGGGAKNKFQYRLNPNSANQFLYLRGIQGTMPAKMITNRRFLFRPPIPVKTTVNGDGAYAVVCVCLCL